MLSMEGPSQRSDVDRLRTDMPIITGGYNGIGLATAKTFEQLVNGQE